jgi:hypothetical protein
MQLILMAEFNYENIMIETNVIHAAYFNKVIKLVFLGSHLCDRFIIEG